MLYLDLRFFKTLLVSGRDNKKVSTRKEGKPEGYWDKWLDRVTQKRNHQMRFGNQQGREIHPSTLFEIQDQKPGIWLE
uniref:hypothetical protein n=1 Tax=Microseira wollei TaxID=467598 RepID=UPI001CFE81E3|nr:hypothetical protein [Microseira wollei]